MSASLLLGFALFAVLFLGIARLSLSRRLPEALWHHPLTFALSFFGVGGILFFFGSIELVGRFGFAGLLGLFAFAGIFIFSPLFLEPLRWISCSHAFATLPDLLVYRYRHPWTARAASLVLALGSLPIAAAQFNAFTLFVGDARSGSFVAPIAMVLVTLLAIAFLRFFCSPWRIVRAVPAITASAALLALAAMLLCGLLAVFQVFGGPAELNQWARQSGQEAVIRRFDFAFALILLFFPLAFIMPQQHFAFSLYKWWPRHSPSAWLIPFVLLLATLPIFPILWAGLHLPLDVPLQHYAAMLPRAQGQEWLHVLVLVATLFIAVSCITVQAVALGKIVVTNFLVDYHPFRRDDLEPWLQRRRFAAATLWLIAALAFATLAESSSVTNLTIAGMVGLIQLLPGLIGTLYMERINHKGFLAGLGVGMAIWGFGLILPLFGEATEADVLGMRLATGAENWPFWLLESLVANLLVTLLVSQLTTMSDEERTHAYRAMVDNLPTPRRRALSLTSLARSRRRLAEEIGPHTATREWDAALEALDIRMDEHRPLAMRMLRDRLCLQLSAKLGTLRAEHIMARVMPLGTGQAVDDISLVESQLAGAGNALSGLAAELNKLRLYHRQTLENLPIGVCSIDPAGEILLWNLTLGKYTGMGAGEAEGANIGDLPAPWGTLLREFLDDEAISWPAREVTDAEGDSRWYHLSKYRVAEHSSIYAGYQVLLMEDITERLRLVQELAHSERLTAVGRLAAGVAHEIGNPVTGISCLAQDLQAESEEQATRDSAATILDLTGRISSIVSTLVDFSRRDSQVDLQPVRLAEAVNNAIQLLELDKSAKVVEFRSTIADDLEVMGDAHQLAQVFVNLLANARDASPEGETIRIQSQRDGSRRIVVHVTDRGCGIPRDRQDRVLEPFYTTKEPGEGTGLGLSLVYSIMRFHGGKVKISSPVEEGRGTRVSLWLRQPVADSAGTDDKHPG